MLHVFYVIIYNRRVNNNEGDERKASQAAENAIFMGAIIFETLLPSMDCTARFSR